MLFKKVQWPDVVPVEVILENIINDGGALIFNLAKILEQKGLQGLQRDLVELQKILIGFQRSQIAFNVNLFNLVYYQIVLMAELQDFQVLAEVLVVENFMNDRIFVLLDAEFLDDPIREFQFGHGVHN